MPSDPSTLFAPARSAYPKYAALLDALAGVIAAEPPPAPVAPVVPSPAPDLSAIAGQPLFLDAGGSLFRADFGDPAGRFNALRGYNAAHVYDSPGNYSLKISRDSQPDSTQTLRVSADTRPQIALAPGDDLAQAIAQLKDNTILLLPAGATFDLHATAVIGQSGVTLRAAGSNPSTAPGTGPSTTAATSPAPRIRRIATPGSYSALGVGGHDVSIEGIEFDSDRPLDAAGGKVGVYAISFTGRNLLVRRCNFRNIDDAVNGMPGAQNLAMLDCTFTNELRAYGAYLDVMKGVAILGSMSAGSKNEHTIRVAGAQNVLIEGNDLTSTTDKECLAVRIGQCVAITNNTLRAWVRVSEGPVPSAAPAPGPGAGPATSVPAGTPPTATAPSAPSGSTPIAPPTAASPPAPSCQHILLSSNHFAGLRPAGTWLQINPGSDDVWIDSNRFDADATQTCVAVQAPCSNIRLTGNTQSLVNGAKTSKPLVTPVNGGQFVETGSSIVN